MGEFGSNDKINVAHGVRVVQAAYPKEWRLVCPKIYQSVDRFCDYRLAALHNANVLIAAKEGKSQSANGTGLYAVNVGIAARFSFPTFFVSKDLFFAALKTEPTQEIDWLTMPLPFEAMNFILPKGAMYVSGDEVSCLQFCRARKGFVTLPESEKGVGLERDIFIACATMSSGSILNFFTQEPYKPSATVQRFDPFDFSPSIREDVKVFNKTYVNIIFNLLFAMAARPELVEAGQKLGRHKKSNSEIWTPNIIGRKYTVKRPEGYEPTGTGTHKRLHWRRGHFRHQPFGKGLTKTKIIWLEPTLIGVKNAEA